MGRDGPSDPAADGGRDAAAADLPLAHRAGRVCVPVCGAAATAPARGVGPDSVVLLDSRVGRGGRHRLASLHRTDRGSGRAQGLEGLPRVCGLCIPAPGDVTLQPPPCLSAAPAWPWGASLCAHSRTGVVLGSPAHVETVAPPCHSGIRECPLQTPPTGRATPSH